MEATPGHYNNHRRILGKGFCSMQKHVFLAFFMLIIFSAGVAMAQSALVKKLDGAWKLDGEEILSLMPEAKEMSPAKRKEMLAQLSETTMKFDVKNKMVAASFGREVQQSSFEIVSEKDNSLVLKSRDGNQMNAEFINNDTIRVSGLNGDLNQPGINFIRQK